MHRTNTRLLLTCAAIGVGSGIPLGITGYLHVVVLALIPIIYGLLISVYFLPGIIAQWLLRRPGVAVITGFVAGLTSSAIDPTQWTRHIGTGLLIGLIQEIPFLFTRFRYWPSWLYYVGALFGGGALAAIMALALDVSRFDPISQVIFMVMFVLGPVLFTWLAQLLAARISKTGVMRGLEYPRDRRGSKATA
ncbi:ECF transporter S component [Mycetocola saprophilus]|uniref:ECF transporter S component n=1 Tax=Mycetocola saprophilus TaxID=76636 RepID=UPI003BF1DAB0